MDESQISREIEHARGFLDQTGSLGEQIVIAAQDLIGHPNSLSMAEWEYYENVRRLCCPWLANEKSAAKGWTPFREAEAIFANRLMVEETLGDACRLQLAFGIDAISSLASAGFMEHVMSGEGHAEYDPAREEAFGGLAAAIAALTLGRQVNRTPVQRLMSDDERQELRRKLNRTAAQKRNEPYRLLHWEFRRYLANNKVKSTRNAAEVFYRALPKERQIYQTVTHAVRNLSEHVYRSSKSR